MSSVRAPWQNDPYKKSHLHVEQHKTHRTPIRNRHPEKNLKKLAIINKSTTRNEFAKISSYSIHSQIQSVKVRTFNRSTRANQLHAWLNTLNKIGLIFLTNNHT